MQREYLEYAKKHLLRLLAIPSPSCYAKEVLDYIAAELELMGYTPERTAKDHVLVFLGGDGPGVLLVAHCDTLGGMVQEVKENGRLRVWPLGLLSPNNAEGENVTIITRSGCRYSGTFQLNEPSYHVNGTYEAETRTFNNMEIVIDELTQSKAETLALGIQTGDILAFDPRSVITESGFIKSRHLDDKLSAAILLTYAKLLSESNHSPSHKVYLMFTGFEETSHGGSANCPADVRDVIAVDMGCVGKGIECDETMVSIAAANSFSPSSYSLVSDLISAGERANAAYSVDVYPYYQSDADAVIKAGHDVRHCSIGAGVYASHGYERSHIKGLENTFDLITAYLE